MDQLITESMFQQSRGGDMSLTRPQAVKKFLDDQEIKSTFAEFYSREMECQVLVAADGGQLVEGKTQSGKKWRGWRDDGGQTWQDFRIPYNSMSEPHYDDPQMSYDPKHIESIGMTGWNWVEKKSVFFAYDFDSIVGHSELHSAKLTDQELNEVLESAKQVPWVTIQRSTGGNGYHLFVEIKNSPEVNNHHEHAALARAILAQMSALVGYDFNSKVDVCGAVIWCWARRSRHTGGRAFQVIKKGIPLSRVPNNWRDHINVVKNRGRCKTKPRPVVADGSIQNFEELSFRMHHTPLDDDHKRLFHWLERSAEYQYWWDQDHHMLICSTLDLQKAHSVLKMKGYFRTASTGSSSQNCFCFPMRNGAFSVRRFSQGCSEDPSWIQDSGGWTRTYFNKECDLQTACRAFGGVEDKQGNFVFRSSDRVQKAIELLGCQFELPKGIEGQEITLSKHKDGRLIVEVVKLKPNELEELLEQKCLKLGKMSTGSGFVFESAQKALEIATQLGCYFDIPEDMTGKQVTLSVDKEGKITIATPNKVLKSTVMDGWTSKKGGPHTQVVNANLNVTTENDIDTRDDLIRSIVNHQESLGWVAFINGVWKSQPMAHIQQILKAEGVNQNDLAKILGDQILNSWEIVNEPFKPEYLGDRKWNRSAASFAYTPSEEAGPHPTWDKLIAHTGKGLDEAVKEDPWCVQNGVNTGGMYFLLWACSMFQRPMMPLPYLFLFSEENNTGKSTFHEALHLLMKRGYARGDLVFSNTSGHNGELEGAVLVAIEEISFAKAKDSVYNKLKDYVTSPHINIRQMRQTAYLSPNSTHWVQTSNNADACPIFSGDSRITAVKQSPLPIRERIPKDVLFAELRKEAPNFLYTLLNTPIPKSNDRLGIPAITTAEKRAIQEINKSPIQLFIEEACTNEVGQLVPECDLFTAFLKGLSDAEAMKWDNKRFLKEISPYYKRGKYPKDDNYYYINCGLKGFKAKEKINVPYKITSVGNIPTITRG